MNPVSLVVCAAVTNDVMTTVLVTVLVSMIVTVIGSIWFLSEVTAVVGGSFRGNGSETVVATGMD